MTANILRNEFYKVSLLTWSYRFNWFVGLVMIVVMFLGITLLFGSDPGGRFESRESFLVGWLVGFYIFNVLGLMTYDLRDEMRMGTLEQMVMSPAPLGTLLMGRVLTSLVWDVVQLVIGACAVMLILNFTLPVNAAGLLVFLLTVVGAIGFGFLAAGLTLIYQHVESFANMIANMLLFTNGTLVAVDQFPAWFATVMRFFPTTQGIAVARQVTLGGRSLADVWASGDLMLLMLHSAASFVIGWLVFSWCERVARRRGTLGQY